MSEQILNVVFKEHEGIEICEIRAPGDKESVKVFPAHSFHRWVKDEIDGTQVQQTYAERWNAQYLRFKERLVQTQDGTPLTDAPFINAQKAAQLRALGFYVLEQVAAAEGRNLKMIGQGGRALQTQVKAFLEGSESDELVRLREEIAALKAAQKPADEAKPDDEPKPAESDDKAALKDEIAELSGVRPKGNPSVETLRDMLADLKASA